MVRFALTEASFFCSLVGRHELEAFSRVFVFLMFSCETAGHSSTLVSIMLGGDALNPRCPCGSFQRNIAIVVTRDMFAAQHWLHDRMTVTEVPHDAPSMISQTGRSGEICISICFGVHVHGIVTFTKFLVVSLAKGRFIITCTIASDIMPRSSRTAALIIPAWEIDQGF
jgi:hypothetical protein